MKTNYLQQRNHKRQFSRVLLVALLLSSLLAIFSFTGTLPSIAQKIYTMLNISSSSVWQSTDGIAAIIKAKPALVKENQQLRSKIRKLEINKLYTTAVQVENKALQKMLNISMANNTAGTNSITARIIEYNNIPYGTILVSVNKNTTQIKNGTIAHFGKLAIGTVSKITDNTALIKLFTSSNSAHDVIVGEHTGTFIGGSNGVGKIMLARDLQIELNTPVTLPSASGLVLGVVKEILHNDEESLQTLLVQVPINIRSLRFITMETQY
jgi:cell shape-determining protein MreC